MLIGALPGESMGCGVVTREIEHKKNKMSTLIFLRAPAGSLNATLEPHDRRRVFILAACDTTQEARGLLGENDEKTHMRSGGRRDFLGSRHGGGACDHDVRSRGIVSNLFRRDYLHRGCRGLLPGRTVGRPRVPQGRA